MMNAKRSFYLVAGPNDQSLSVVRTDEMVSYEELDSLRAGADWSPKTIVAGPGRLVDHPPNNLVGWSFLCSERMREVLEPFSNLFRWLEVTVMHGGSAHRYFSLLGVGFPDVLDHQQTIRNPKTSRIIKAVLSESKVRDLDLLMRHEGSLTPVCSRRVRRALEVAQISGLAFERVAIR